MWFKNILVYTFGTDFTVDTDHLQDKLSDFPFEPCKSIETYRTGWVTPAATSDQFSFISSRRILLCLKRQEKVIPASVVNEALKEKVQTIEEKEHRKPGRKEKLSLKEEILTDLTPRAFARSSYTWGYIDLNSQQIIIDASSAKKADEFLDLLRQTLGSLPVAPLNTEISPAVQMTEWLGNANSRPAGLELDGQCELRSDLDEGSVIRCKQQELDAEDVLSHLESGKQVTKLAINWQDRVQCILNEDLSIKRLRFGDDLIEEAQDSYADEDPLTRLDTDFTLMSLELHRFILAVIEWLGGQRQVH